MNHDISAILLAAGESKRMGATNKLNLSINGTPMLLNTVITLLISGLRELVVVVGHEEHLVRKILAGLPLTIISNPKYKEGQMTSVYHGLTALKAKSRGIMIALSDQPLLTIPDIQKIKDTFLTHCDKPILVPTFKGQRGNPIVINSEHRETILAGHYSLGCRYLIEKQPDLVSTVEMDSRGIVFDIDTPQDYEDYQQVNSKKSTTTC